MNCIYYEAPVGCMCMCPHVHAMSITLWDSSPHETCKLHVVESSLGTCMQDNGY